MIKWENNEQRIQVQGDIFKLLMNHSSKNDRKGEWTGFIWSF